MDPVLAVVDGANQRGGRMLSVPDLVAAETLSRETACRLLTRIEAGSSWLVGARPGGAGKTTVMAALLAMLPPGETCVVTRGRGWSSPPENACVVCYEVSPGAYDGYIWGEDAARLCRLGREGTRIVANLHADTVEEARDQIVGDCGASEEEFGAFDLFLPIELGRGFRPARRVTTVWECIDGNRSPLEDAPLTDRENAVGAFLDDCAARRIFTVEDVRAAWIAFLES